MSKAGKLLRAIQCVLKEPALLNHVIDDNEQWRKRVEAHYPGFSQFTVEELFDVISTDFNIVSPYSFLSGGSMPTDLLLLKGLAGKFEKCRYFEIGTWRGESVANVSAVADKCVTVDLPEDEKRQLGFNDKYIQEYARYSATLPNVNHLCSNTRNLDFSALGKFDLIFIDGDHHYDSIFHDTRKVIANLLHDQSIVVWHDYMFHPEKVRYETLNAILDSMPAQKHTQIHYIQNTMCAVFLPDVVNRKKININAFTVKISAL